MMRCAAKTAPIIMKPFTLEEHSGKRCCLQSDSQIHRMQNAHADVNEARLYTGAHQLKRVIFQRATAQPSRKISMAAASASRAGQFRPRSGARARTASVMKIAVAVITRR